MLTEDYVALRIIELCEKHKTKDGIRPDLSAGQLELVETWEYLDDKEREILLTFVRSLQKK